MGSQEWQCLESDVLVPVARMPDADDAFERKFGRNVKDEFREHGWAVQFDEDEEEVDGRTSLVGLSLIADGPDYVTSGFEDALIALAPFVEGTGVLRLEAEDGGRKNVHFGPFAPEDPMVGGKVEWRTLRAHHVDMKDPDDVHCLWKSFIADLIRAGKDPLELKRAIDEAACEQVVAA